MTRILNGNLSRSWLDFTQTKEALSWRLHSCGASEHWEANPLVFTCFIFPAVNGQLQRFSSTRGPNEQVAAAFIVSIAYGNYTFYEEKMKYKKQNVFSAA